MFQDLTSDDIFCIETKRFWLRWPRAADAPAITSFAKLAEVAQATAGIPHPYPPGEAERFILKARADNASGKALILAMTQKTGARQVIGVISATPAGSDIELGYVLAPPMWGKGFTSEVAKPFVDTLFRLSLASRIVANSRVQNVASRRVLEKTGFTFVDSGLHILPARGGMHPCDRFQLDRKTWAANLVAAGESQSMPAMAQQPPDENEGKVLAAASEQIDI
ncbi:MAG TPA: GNAT family N-acetyltransferase [Methylocella sp.]|nr:GNAT family N-acetyltransferase [Methylocella sp.]